MAASHIRLYRLFSRFLLPRLVQHLPPCDALLSHGAAGLVNENQLDHHNLHGRLHLLLKQSISR
jgi:hypothetical protein